MFLSLLFCSIQALNGDNDAHHIGEDRSSLFSLLIQMPLSSGNTLTGIPRNNISSAI